MSDQPNIQSGVVCGLGYALVWDDDDMELSLSRADLRPVTEEQGKRAMAKLKVKPIGARRDHKSQMGPKPVLSIWPVEREGAA